MIQDSKPTSELLKSNKEAFQIFHNHITKIENGLNFKETSYKENFKLSISNIKSDLYEIMMEVMFVKDKLQNIFLKNQVRLNNNNTYIVDSNNICSDGNNNQHINSINSTSSNITNTISSCVSNSNSISKHVHQTNQIFLNINNYNHPNENIYNYDYKYKINKSNNFNIINTISNISNHNNQCNLTNITNMNLLNSNRNSHLNTYFSSDLKRANKNEETNKGPNEINNQISNHQEDSSAFLPERQQFRNNIFHLNNSKSQFIKINTYNKKLKKIINYSNCNISLEKCNSNSHIGYSNLNQKHESKVGIGGYYDNTNTQSSNVVMAEKKRNINDFNEESTYKYNKYVNFLKEKEGKREKNKKKNQKSISIYEKSSQTSNSSRGLLKLKCINNKILNEYNISNTNKNNNYINNSKTSHSTLNNQISNKSTILLKVKNIEKEEKSMKSNLNLNKSNSKTRPTSKSRSTSKVINSNMNINSYVYKNSNNSSSIGNNKKIKYNINIYNNENDHENENESNKKSINPNKNTRFNSNNNDNYRLSEYINSKSEIKKKRILNVDVLEINLKDPKFNHTQTFRSYNKINENQNGDPIQDDNFKFNPLNENNQNKGSYPYYMFKNSYSKSKKNKNHCNEELFHSNYYPSSSSNSNKSQIYSKLLRRVDVINKSKQTTQHISHLGEIFNMNKVEIFLDDDKKNNYNISNEQVIHNHKNIKIELNE